MNKKVVIFVENALTNDVKKIDLPEDYDGNMGNFIAKLAVEHGPGCKYYVGGLA